jgi:hypothetical protein
MAKDDDYLSYEQVLQELQINRSRLNQLIREGRLTEQLVEGETKFRMVEVRDIRRTMEKSPTVMEEEEGAEPETDLLEDQSPAISAEPKTEIIEEGEETTTSPPTELLEEDTGPASARAVRETILLEEDEGEETSRPTEVLADDRGRRAGEARETILLEDSGPVTDRTTEMLEGGLSGAELELDLPEGASDIDLEVPLTEDVSASQTDLETELELEVVAADAEGADEATVPVAAEEEFFDFSGEIDSDEFELEARAEEEEVAEEPLEVAPEEPTDVEEEEIVTDILQLGVEEEVPEEDLLSEIMDIDEEQAVEAATVDETEDITAEITTMEEPVYEESDLGEVLDVGEEAEFDMGLGEVDEFQVPYAEPIEMAEAPVSGGFVALLIVTLIIMGLAALFVTENASRPEFSTGLVKWAANIF